MNMTTFAFLGGLGAGAVIGVLMGLLLAAFFIRFREDPGYYEDDLEDYD